MLAHAAVYSTSKLFDTLIAANDDDSQIMVISIWYILAESVSVAKPLQYI